MCTPFRCLNYFLKSDLRSSSLITRPIAKGSECVALRVRGPRFARSLGNDLSPCWITGQVFFVALVWRVSSPRVALILAPLKDSACCLNLQRELGIQQIRLRLLCTINSVVFKVNTLNLASSFAWSNAIILSLSRTSWIQSDWNYSIFTLGLSRFPLL